MISSAGSNKGLYLFSITKEGRIRKKSFYSVGSIPTYMATKGKYLFVSNKTNNSECMSKGGISLFSIKGSKIVFCTEFGSSDKKSYTHLCAPEYQKWVAGANYHTGTVEIYSYKGEKIFSYYAGDDAHIHCVGYLTKRNLLYCIDLGNSNIIVINCKSNHFEVANVISLNKNIKPRHFVFGRDEKYIYILNEFPASISVYMIERDHLILIQEEKCKVETSHSNITGAAIRMSEKKEFLFVSVRGENIISMYRILNDGRIQYSSSFSTKGICPRDFDLSNDKYLIVCNQKSNLINCFSIDFESLTFKELDRFEIEQPSSIVWR